MLFLRSLVFILIAVNAVLCTLVFFSDRKAKQNRMFLFFVGFLDLWILTNFLENEPGIIGLENLELFLRLDFVFAAFLFYSWFRFCSIFAKSKLSKPKWEWLNILLFWFVILLSYLSLFTQTILTNVRFEEGVIAFDDGAFWFIYGIAVLAFAVSGLFILYFGRKKAKKEKNTLFVRQINFIFAGFLLSIGNGIIINFLQAFFPISLEISRLGLYGMTVLVLFTSYAILKHQLMNISIIATELFVFILIILELVPLFEFEKIYTAPSQYFMNLVIFLITLVFSILLIKSVRKEVKLREKLAITAKSLENANVRLKELDQQKTEFLSIASHQLRTPLSIIKGYIELISDGAFGKATPKMKNILEKMDESNERLVKLIDEFLDITRIEQGRTKYSFEKLNLSDVIDSVVTELSQKSGPKGIKIIWDKPKKSLLAAIDEEKIRHVIYNFVDNAIKYTVKGNVNIKVDQRNNKLYFHVIDHGLGFSEQDQKGLFTKFYRAENVKRAKVNGTGLGIFVCKKFVEAHNGEVWAKSPGVGKGAEFGFWIPKKHKK